MKKFSYLIVCIVFMFSFYDNVFAKICSSIPTCGSNERRDAGAPVANYINTCGNDNGQNGFCNVSNNASVSSNESSTVQIDPDSGNKYNECYYKCYEKRKVLIMIDDSNSIRESKLKQIKEAVKAIADAMTPNVDKLRICYFNYEDDNNKSNCIKVGGKEWIDPTQGRQAVQKLEKKPYNTDFVSAYNRADEIFKDGLGNYIPVLFFITDGYPTANPGDALGYLSSAKYAFQAANRLENLVSSMKNRTYSGNNVYAKNNARVITVGVGIGGNDNYAKFILNPTEGNKNALASSGTSEEVTLRSMLDGNRVQNELVAGVCSFPDKGGVSRGNYLGVNSNNGNARVEFTELSKYKNENKAQANGICFTLGQNWDLSKVTLKCSTKKGKKCGEKGSGFADVPSKYVHLVGNGNIKSYKLDYEYFSQYSGATYRLVWNTSTTGNLSSYDKRGVNFKYSSVYGSYLGVNDEAIVQLKQALQKGATNNPFNFDYNVDESFFRTETVKKVTHNNCTGANGNNTVQVKPQNDVFVINGTSYNSISVPVVITEDAKFDAGNLDENFSVNAGRGFIINNAYVENTIRWYYSYFDDYSGNTPSDPIVYYGSDSKTSLSSLRKANGRSYSNEELDQLVWNAIKTSKLETNEAKERVKEALTTVDSNNVDKISTIPLEVTVSEGSNCATVYNSDRSSGNKSCTIKYTISQPKGCFKTNDQNEQEFAYGSNCNGNYNYNVDKPNQYFIPFAHEIGELPINITGNFSSVKELDLNFNTSCKVTVGQGTFKGYPDKLVYRTIDVENPFPKSNNELSKIAVNWRNWYCSNGDSSSGNCAIDHQNEMRLANSYNSSRLLYSVNLNDSVIDNIVSDTNSGNYYYSFGTINNSGSSNFVNNRIISNLFSIHNATNSYCELGKFSESCDQYQ